MAKKNKKFKKKISQNLSERIAQIQLEEKAAAPASSQVISKNEKAPLAEVETTSAKYAYVKKDIRRDFLIILLLVLLLVTATILNSKTSYLKDFANWIYTILNLKI
jgi:hypothetical protein